MSAPGTWCVYVLRCADRTYYTGVTNDLAKRLAAHRAGTASKYTRARLPVRLVITAGAWPTRGPALSFEARVKRLPRRRKLAMLRAARATAP